jgi:hypothetical protein
VSSSFRVSIVGLIYYFIGCYVGFAVHSHSSNVLLPPGYVAMFVLGLFGSKFAKWIAE